MNIKTIRRQPDTCSCQLLYEYDNDLPLEQRTFNVLYFEQLCPFHENVVGITSQQQLYDEVIIVENKKKNYAIQIVKENAPSQMIDIIAEDGHLEFKKGISVYWTWSGIAPNRLLTILVYGFILTQNQINSINNKLNERFGISNVNISNG